MIIYQHSKNRIWEDLLTRVSSWNPANTNVLEPLRSTMTSLPKRGILSLHFIIESHWAISSWWVMIPDIASTKGECIPLIHMCPICWWHQSGELLCSLQNIKAFFGCKNKIISEEANHSRATKKDVMNQTSRKVPLASWFSCREVVNFVYYCILFRLTQAMQMCGLSWIASAKVGLEARLRHSSPGWKIVAVWRSARCKRHGSEVWDLMVRSHTLRHAPCTPGLPIFTSTQDSGWRQATGMTEHSRWPANCRCKSQSQPFHSMKPWSPSLQHPFRAKKQSMLKYLSPSRIQVAAVHFFLPNKLPWALLVLRKKNPKTRGETHQCLMTSSLEIHTHTWQGQVGSERMTPGTLQRHTTTYQTWLQKHDHFFWTVVLNLGTWPASILSI